RPGSSRPRTPAGPSGPEPSSKASLSPLAAVIGRAHSVPADDGKHPVRAEPAAATEAPATATGPLSKGPRWLLPAGALLLAAALAAGPARTESSSPIPRSPQ